MRRIEGNKVGLLLRNRTHPAASRAVPQAVILLNTDHAGSALRAVEPP